MSLSPSRIATLREIRVCIRNGVDLGDEERAFVRAAYLTAKQADTSDQRFAQLIDAIGNVAVIGHFVDDGWELVSPEFYPDDM